MTRSACFWSQRGHQRLASLQLAAHITTNKGNWFPTMNEPDTGMARPFHMCTTTNLLLRERSYPEDVYISAASLYSSQGPKLCCFGAWISVSRAYDTAIGSCQDLACPRKFGMHQLLPTNSLAECRPANSPPQFGRSRRLRGIHTDTEQGVPPCDLLRRKALHQAPLVLSLSDLDI